MGQQSEEGPVWKTKEPESAANFLSSLLFFWIQPLFSRASALHREGKALEHEDLVPLTEEDHGDVLSERFDSGWDSAKPEASTEAKLRKAILRVLGTRLYIAGAIKFFNTSLQFAFPLLLNAILKFFEDIQSGKDVPSRRGYILSVCLFVAIASKAITENSYFHRTYRCSWQARSAVSAAVYHKSLRMARSTSTLGELVNLMQVDATKIEMFVPQIHVLWDGIFQIAGYLTILGTLIGWPCLAGLGVMLLAGPVQGKIMGKLFGQSRAMVKYTDERVKTTNEALQGIRCVKMYTWEDSLAQVIGQAREQELLSLRTIAYLRGFSRAYMSALPTVAAVTSFVVFAYATDRQISASTLFAALVAFDQLRFPLLFYPLALAQLAQAKVSLTRLAAFLGHEEVSNEGYSKVDGPGEVTIKSASLFWSDPKVPIKKKDDDDSSMRSSMHTEKTTEEGVLLYPKPVVSDVSVRMAVGELTAVVGRVGAGKTSLCSAILNESVLGEGSIVEVHGSIAYASQSAWILNQTVRENILFGLPYEEERYNRVVQACQLTHDLDMLEDGDMTEIGERGINLSGGQKQRISVARAAYSKASIVILDDPLSALDPEVAGKLFEECVLGIMKDRTRVLVTNQLQCLSRCDKVIAIGDHRILEQGTYHELMQDEGGEVQRLLKDLRVSQETEKDSKTDGATEKSEDALGSTERKDKDTKKAKSLTTTEERAVGAVKPEVYLKYIRAGGGYMRFTLVFITFILSSAISLMNSVWVSLWTSDSNYERRGKGFYLGFYALTAVLLGIVTFGRSYMLAKFGVRASSVLHKNLLASVLQAPMSFFDTTPTGRILSRFSKDLYSIDQELSDYLDFVMFMIISVLVSVGTIIFTTPWFGVALAPLAYVYYRILNYFREVSRETKRLESLSRSPVYAHFSETLGGLSTIRAYGEAARFVSEFDSKLDENIRAVYNNKTADRWLSARLELIGSVIAGLAACFATQSIVSNAVSGGNKSSFASLAGLSLTFAISITGMLNWVVRSFAQVEAAMNSCERVFYYSENIAQEAPATGAELENHHRRNDSELRAVDIALTSSNGKALTCPKEWPAKGTIVMNNLKMRYRKDTPLVLKGLTIEMQGGERIGIVGRTGSGKSSLLLTLLRIVEPDLSDEENYSPPLMIDGVDVLRIGLKELRSQLGIIPQNPVLFSGTIRSNMDPFNNYPDDALWSALARCGMQDYVRSLPEELEAPVAEYGENLSQGQRQLLCLGRALLKQCRVLLLDEATSSVDYETDREIQRTLRESFAHSTVLTIAHRVNTILDSDKILVMKDGVAAEYGPPQELLSQEDSLFTDIVKHSKAEDSS